MRLADIKLTEAKYTAGKIYYFVQAWDPEDGDLELFAGPFYDEVSAKKFVNIAEEAVKRKVSNMNIEEQHYPGLLLPTFHVQKITDPQDFLQAMDVRITKQLRQTGKRIKISR